VQISLPPEKVLQEAAATATVIADATFYDLEASVLLFTSAHRLRDHAGSLAVPQSFDQNQVYQLYQF
jgi:hypothetical protein